MNCDHDRAVCEWSSRFMLFLKTTQKNVLQPVQNYVSGFLGRLIGWSQSREAGSLNQPKPNRKFYWYKAMDYLLHVPVSNAVFFMTLFQFYLHFLINIAVTTYCGLILRFHRIQPWHLLQTSRAVQLFDCHCLTTSFKNSYQMLFQTWTQVSWNTGH